MIKVSVSLLPIATGQRIYETETVEFINCRNCFDWFLFRLPGRDRYNYKVITFVYKCKPTVRASILRKFWHIPNFGTYPMIS